MFNAEAKYKNSAGHEVHLFLDIDLKTEVIIDFKVSGNLKLPEEAEFNQLKKLILNHPINSALSLKREKLQSESTALSSLPLWLMHRAIEDYLGTTATMSEQNDLLCLCYGIGVREIKTQVLARSDYDLPQLVAETFATSACGSCKGPIARVMEQIRVEHGKIRGMTHSQTNLDKEGKWIKIKGYYPADLIIKLDELKMNWMKREGISDQFQIEIEKIEGHHIWLKVFPESDIDRNTKVLAALSDFWKSEIGALFFLHLSSTTGTSLS